MAYKQKGFSPFTKEDGEKKKTFTGKIWDSLEAVNTAIKNKDYDKNTTGVYEFHFKGDDGKINTKTWKPTGGY
tara:strand:+ start:91 stop:309 length:219 start_codon:yes stop_codon:yes gene_type:complete